MEFTWKKALIGSALFLVVVVLPVLLISSAMMSCYQARIDRNPQSDFNKWLQMAEGDVCLSTMRPEMAAEAYRRFRDNYPRDERRPRAELRYAFALEESHRNADAVAEYERYLDHYPDRDDKKEALAGIDRIRFGRSR
jgi:outer membrane protein assembly factor BamD (BamD/ComL family)